MAGVKAALFRCRTYRQPRCRSRLTAPRADRMSLKRNGFMDEAAPRQFDELRPPSQEASLGACKCMVSNSEALVQQQSASGTWSQILRRNSICIASRVSDVWGSLGCGSMGSRGQTLQLVQRRVPNPVHKAKASRRAAGALIAAPVHDSVRCSHVCRHQACEYCDPY